ncbi:MAG TPA: FMN-binding negative transcriptional regulator [Burkholderiaceae bacterium]|jgi:transcriptional regulator|nr:FMN-binding negative transcriptional regulator [Burkholderiaceae bacterium]
MYLPAHFRADDEAATAHMLMREAPFATLVSTLDGEPFATHLPLHLSEDGATLTGHFARPNPHARAIGSGAKALAVFHGPHAYVSPRWYERHPAVPTWNYAVVHAMGELQALDDAGLLGVLASLVGDFEGQPLPQDVMPQDYVDQLRKGIVGFSMRIDSLQAKLKFGQHRALADQRGVEEALLATGREGDAQLVELQRRLGYPRERG